MKVYLELITSLQDQPECWGSNYLMLGSGKNSAQWGYSCDTGTVAKYLPSCSSCQDLNSRETVSPAYCGKCTNWEIDRENYPLLQSSTPKTYPPDAITPGKKYLSPFRLAYDGLKTAVAVSHSSYVNGLWSTENVKQYLYSHCINKEAVQFVIRNAKNTKILKTLEESYDVIQHHVLAKHRDNNPDLYNMWKHPALWDRGLTLYIHVDVPMHLLFLGVMKTVAK